jgi:hypothetical protein
MANKSDDFPQFTPLDAATLEKLVSKIPQFLQNITTVLGIADPNEILVDQEILFEIISRVEKRRVYFHIYHHIKMGELNESALFCFWILKLMPFKHDTISTSLLNAKIAFTLFHQMLFYIAKKTGKQLTIKKAVAQHLLYAFQYRDLSKEAIMAIGESLLQ